MGNLQQVAPPLGWGQLEVFIFHPDPYHADSVPKGLHYDTVAKFIDERIVAATPRGTLAQVEKVVDFYDLQEACPHLRGLTERKEKTPDDVRRSTVIIRTMGLVCLPPDLGFTLDYAKYLVTLSSTLPEFQDLIRLNDALDGKSDSAQLKSRMELRLAALDRRRQNEYQAQLEYANLEDTMNIKLNRSQRANELKAKILAIPDRSQRMSEEIKMYLTLRSRYLEFLQAWAARRLRRETWGLQPGQQTKRAENPELREDVAKAFRTTLSSLAPSRELPKENLPSLRIRCLRAIEYFGGQISKSEQEFIEKEAGRQVDQLSK